MKIPENDNKVLFNEKSVSFPNYSFISKKFRFICLIYWNWLLFSFENFSEKEMLKKTEKKFLYNL